MVKEKDATIYVDSRKRVASSDSDFEVDLGAGRPRCTPSSERTRVPETKLGPSVWSTLKGLEGEADGEVG